MWHSEQVLEIKAQDSHQEEPGRGARNPPSCRRLSRRAPDEGNAPLFAQALEGCLHF